MKTLLTLLLLAATIATSTNTTFGQYSDPKAHNAPAPRVVVQAVPAEKPSTVPVITLSNSPGTTIVIGGKTEPTASSRYHSTDEYYHDDYTADYGYVDVEASWPASLTKTFVVKATEADKLDAATKAWVTENKGKITDVKFLQPTMADGLILVVATYTEIKSVKAKVLVDPNVTVEEKKK